MSELPLPRPRSAADDSVDLDDAATFARFAAHRLIDGKLEDVVILDLRGLSAVAEFFVIGTGTSDRQLRSALDIIEDESRPRGRRTFGGRKDMSSAWLIADYVDVIVHAFNEDARSYYDLESLWGDAPRLPLTDTADAASNRQDG